jgi:hypothetical protein
MSRYNQTYSTIESNKIETDFDDMYLMGDKLLWRVFNDSGIFCETFWEPDHYENGCFYYKDNKYQNLSDVVLLPSRPEIILSHIKHM